MQLLLHNPGLWMKPAGIPESTEFEDAILRMIKGTNLLSRLELVSLIFIILIHTTLVCFYIRLCNYIKGPAFEKCNKKIVVNSYYDKCLKDMCECELDNLQCHCQSFTDYVRDCRKLGILMSGWKNSVGC